jgi:hypothetical protein
MADMMTTAGNVLALLGALVTGYGLFRLWRRASSHLSHTIAPTGIPSGEAFGTPTVTTEDRTWSRNLAAKARRWFRFGRPIHHTADANLDVTVTPTAALLRLRGGGPQAELLAQIERRVDVLASETASARVQDREHNATLIKNEIAAYQAAERGRTRQQTIIAAIGLVMATAGIVLRLLAGG